MARVLIDLDVHPRRFKLRLRVAMSAAAQAAQLLDLPAALQTRVSGDTAALWLGPDQWLMVSDRVPAAAVAEKCAGVLDGLSYHTAEVTAALACARVQGAAVRELLTMGSGIDWEISRVPVAQCRRTRFARIPIVVHAVAADAFELYYDRSYRHYLECWFAHATSDPLIAQDSCRTTF